MNVQYLNEVTERHETVKQELERLHEIRMAVIDIRVNAKMLLERADNYNIVVQRELDELRALVEHLAYLSEPIVMNDEQWANYTP